MMKVIHYKLGRLKEIVCFASNNFENWTRARENKTQTPGKNPVFSQKYPVFFR